MKFFESERFRRDRRNAAFIKLQRIQALFLYFKIEIFESVHFLQGSSSRILTSMKEMFNL